MIIVITILAIDNKDAMTIGIQKDGCFHAALLFLTASLFETTVLIAVFAPSFSEMVSTTMSFIPFLNLTSFSMAFKMFGAKLSILIASSVTAFAALAYESSSFELDCFVVIANPVGWHKFLDGAIFGCYCYWFATRLLKDANCKSNNAFYILDVIVFLYGLKGFKIAVCDAKLYFVHPIAIFSFWRCYVNCHILIIIYFA